MISKQRVEQRQEKEKMLREYFTRETYTALFFNAVTDPNPPENNTKNYKEWLEHSRKWAKNKLERKILDEILEIEFYGLVRRSK